MLSDTVKNHMLCLMPSWKTYKDHNILASSKVDFEEHGAINKYERLHIIPMRFLSSDEKVELMDLVPKLGSARLDDIQYLQKQIDARPRRSQSQGLLELEYQKALLQYFMDAQGYRFEFFDLYIARIAIKSA